MLCTVHNYPTCFSSSGEGGFKLARDESGGMADGCIVDGSNGSDDPPSATTCSTTSVSVEMTSNGSSACSGSAWFFGSATLVGTDPDSERRSLKTNTKRK